MTAQDPRGRTVAGDAATETKVTATDAPESPEATEATEAPEAAEAPEALPTLDDLFAAEAGSSCSIDGTCD